jgi:hypothetical protein
VGRDRFFAIRDALTMTRPDERSLSLMTVIACVLLAAGCASANSTMLSEDTELIYATGADPSQREQVLKAALTKAAEVTRARGYRYFVILTAEDTTRTVTIPIPGQTFPNETSHERTFGATYLHAPERPGNTYTAPDTQVQRVRPGLDLLIRMYQAGAIAEMDGVWDAEEMLPSPAYAR